jgi:predicted PurR-regulated permease PerM
MRSPSSYFIQFGFYALLLLIAIGIVFSFSFVFAVIFISIVCSLLLEPIVNYFETKGLSRVAVILGIYLVVALLFAFAIFFFTPLIIAEAKIFLGNLPAYGDKIHDLVTTLQKMVKDRFPGFALPDYYSYARDKALSILQTVMSSIPDFASKVASLLAVALLVPIVTFFILADGHLITKAVLRMVPNRYFEMSVLLVNKIVESLSRYVRGQLLDSCSIGILTTVGFAIIGLPYFLAVGILSALANFIPYFGPIISLVLAAFVVLITPGAFTVGMVFGILVVFLCVQIIDGTIVYPNVVGRTVHLHPLVVLLGITAGGNMAGILGMLLAIPIISICKVTVEVLYTYLKSYSII